MKGVESLKEQAQKENRSSLQILLCLFILPLVFFANNLFAFLFSILTGLKGGLTFSIIVSLSQALLLVIFTLYFAIIQWKMTLTDLGLGREGWLRGFWRGLSSGPIVFLIVVLGGALVEQIRPFSGEVQPFTQMVLQAGSLPELIILCMLGVVIAPIAEEIYFRGLLFPVFKEQLGPIGGIIFSSFIFGLLHFDLLRFIPLALGGVALAWLYERTKSLYASITAHSVWNAIMLLILLSQKG